MEFGIINYSTLFAGIGIMVISFVVAFILYRFYKKAAEWFDCVVDKDIKYSIIEEKAIDKVAEKNGINLAQEMIKNKIYYKKSKQKELRRKLEEQVFEEVLGKQKK